MLTFICVLVRACCG